MEDRIPVSCRAVQDGRAIEGAAELTLIYAANGAVRVALGGEKIALRRGCVLLTDACPELLHRQGGSPLVLPFLCDMSVPVLNYEIEPTADERCLLGLLLRERESLGREGAEAFAMEQSLLCAVVISLVRRDPPRVELHKEQGDVRGLGQAICKYLCENYTSRITLDSLCFLFRTNKTSICRDFRREYGMTVMDYLHALRIGEAKRLIADGGLSVTEIAGRLGFESIHYFCRLFKRLTGMTPTEYSASVLR